MSLRARNLDSNRARASQWDDLWLPTAAYHSLLRGQIEWPNEDREALWDVVLSHANRGYSRNWWYLKHALFYGNTFAVRKLLESGWNANGPGWAFLSPPLGLAIRLRDTSAESAGNAVYTDRAIGDFFRLTLSDTSVYGHYPFFPRIDTDTQAGRVAAVAAIKGKIGAAKANTVLLKQYGARHSWIHSKGGRKFILYSKALVLIGLLLYPFLLPYHLNGWFCTCDGFQVPTIVLYFSLSFLSVSFFLAYQSPEILWNREHVIDFYPAIAFFMPLCLVSAFYTLVNMLIVMRKCDLIIFPHGYPTFAEECLSALGISGPIGKVVEIK
jgi:hypothetical protein